MSPDEMRDLGWALIKGADAIEEVRELREELKRERAKYSKLLSDDIAHGRQMVGTMLSAVLENARREDQEKGE